MPDCSTSPVDDHSAGCIDSVLHNVNYARSLEGLGPLVLPSDYASDSVPVQQLVITDEERGDRGLSEYSGLDATLNTAALDAAEANADPALPSGFQAPGGVQLRPGLHPARGGLRLDVRRRVRRHQPRLPLARQRWLLGAPGQHPRPVDVHRNPDGDDGDGNTSAGQYAEIFATQQDPADPLVDKITPGALPTPSTASAPDVVQVLPASSPSAGAGTPVTIEGNYFSTSPVPQVFFGGVPATDVQVNWDGELTADAPADPAGTATDQVVVTVSTGAGSSSSTGTPTVNEFTYAPTSAPTITSVSPTSGSQIPSGSVTIHGSNFYDGGVTPIVDFGTVASIGSISISDNWTQITTTIPPAINSGTVNITVTTPAGTSAISSADQYAYAEGRTPMAPTITSGDQATFSAGTAGVFDITTTGTPDASSVTDTAFSGCTPSSAPGQHHAPVHRRHDRHAGGNTSGW